jgi:hypothetical protein
MAALWSRYGRGEPIEIGAVRPELDDSRHKSFYDPMVKEVLTGGLLSGVMLQRCSHVAALVLAFAATAACSPLLRPIDEMASAAPPDYGVAVARHIRKVFTTLPPANTFEISAVRWLHAQGGWSWLACVRFQDRDHQRTYSVFIDGGAVIDARYSVRSDGCDAQAYSPFDPMSGTIGRAGTVEQSPIY